MFSSPGPLSCLAPVRGSSDLGSGLVSVKVLLDFVQEAPALGWAVRQLSRGMGSLMEDEEKGERGCKGTCQARKTGDEGEHRSETRIGRFQKQNQLRCVIWENVNRIFTCTRPCGTASDGIHVVPGFAEPIAGGMSTRVKVPEQLVKERVLCGLWGAGEALTVPNGFRH